MNKYLLIFNLGCNGQRRGDVVNAVPRGYFERNPGEGIWEDDSGEGVLLIELRDEPARDLGEEDHCDDEDDETE